MRLQVCLLPLTQARLQPRHGCLVPRARRPLRPALGGSLRGFAQPHQQPLDPEPRPELDVEVGLSRRLQQLAVLEQLVVVWRHAVHALRGGGVDQILLQKRAVLQEVRRALHCLHPLRLALVRQLSRLEAGLGAWRLQQHALAQQLHHRVHHCHCAPLHVLGELVLLVLAPLRALHPGIAWLYILVICACPRTRTSACPSSSSSTGTRVCKPRALHCLLCATHPPARGGVHVRLELPLPEPRAKVQCILHIGTRHSPGTLEVRLLQFVHRHGVAPREVIQHRQLAPVLDGQLVEALLHVLGPVAGRPFWVHRVAGQRGWLQPRSRFLPRSGCSLQLPHSEPIFPECCLCRLSPARVVNSALPFERVECAEGCAWGRSTQRDHHVHHDVFHENGLVTAHAAVAHNGGGVLGVRHVAHPYPLLRCALDPQLLAVRLHGGKACLQCGDGLRPGVGPLLGAPLLHVHRGRPRLEGGRLRAHVIHCLAAGLPVPGRRLQQVLDQRFATRVVGRRCPH